MNALDHDKAFVLIQNALHEYEAGDGFAVDAVVKALEACVVPDPRWQQVEALCAEGDAIDGMVPATWIRGVINGEPNAR